MNIAYDYFLDRIDSSRLIKQYGVVSRVAGLVVESKGPAVPVGSLCSIESAEDGRTTPAEVVGFKDSTIFLMPLGTLQGINPGSIVTSTAQKIRVPVGDNLLGRVLDGLGRPIDMKGPIMALKHMPLEAKPHLGEIFLELGRVGAAEFRTNEALVWFAVVEES